MPSGRFVTTDAYPRQFLEPGREHRLEGFWQVRNQADLGQNAV